MNNTRFATAIHILALLADSREEWVSSEVIAGSINVNPVIVRKELRALHSAGMVEGRKGKEGGSRLSKPSSAILLSDIYMAVKNSEVLGKKNLHTNPRCLIGQQINEKLEDLFRTTDQLVVGFLSNQTLAGFVRQFHGFEVLQ